MHGSAYDRPDECIRGRMHGDPADAPTRAMGSLAGHWPMRSQAIRAMATRVRAIRCCSSLATMRMGAILVGRDGRIAYLNDAGKEALHAPSSDLILRGDVVAAVAPDAYGASCNVGPRQRVSRMPFVDGAVLLTATDGSGIADAAARAVDGTHGRPAEAAPTKGSRCCASAARASGRPSAAMLAQLFGLTAAESSADGRRSPAANGSISMRGAPRRVARDRSCAAAQRLRQDRRREPRPT